MDPEHETERPSRRGPPSKVQTLVALVACALLGVAASEAPERAQRLGFVAVSGVVALSAWWLLVLAFPRGRGLLAELAVCVIPAAFGGLLLAIAMAILWRELPGVRALTEHLWIDPFLAAFLSGTAAVGMVTLLARAALAPRSPGAPRSDA